MAPLNPTPSAADGCVRDGASMVFPHSSHHRREGSALSVSALSFFAGPSTARAACNLIPGTEKSFAGTLGATNRPYSAPGERVELRLRGCDASPGFLLQGADHVVTLA